MRAFKSQCSLFKEMYSDYKKGNIDSETKHGMEEHRSECAYCREWSLSIDEDREDKTETNEKINFNGENKGRSINI